MASSVWSVGKEAEYSHLEQEDVVINSLHALSFRDGSEGRKPRGEIRKFVDENN